MPFSPTPHPTAKFNIRPPILPIPTAAQMARMGWTQNQALDALMKREELIRKEKSDPLRYGWESPIWRLCDMLLDLPWVDKVEASSVRAALGFARPVDILLINGGNRGGKTQYGARTVSKVLWSKPEARAYCFHQSERDSVEQQQPVMHQFLPPELRIGGRKGIKTATTYIAYSLQNGFSEARFVLPNKSTCSFRNYGQEITTHEGLEPDVIWCDEAMGGAELIQTLKGRLATRAGKMIITFTPITGWTPTVRLFVQSARAALEETALLLPKDGGAPAVEESMFTEDIIATILKRPAYDLRVIPEKRTFERVPRVMKCHDDKAAVVFFHTMDNPFGNPRNTWDLWKGSPREQRLIRMYGVAEKSATNMFPKFTEKVHVVPDAAIPKIGTRYHFVDPASGRNFFMHWWIVTPEGAYLHREWPGAYEIPTVGFPGPWAENDGKLLDGKRGPAQKPFGWGLERYKREIARLEGWKDALPKKGAGSADKPKPIREWLNQKGDAEFIFERRIDSRAASSPRVENDRPVTLQTDFEDMGLYFLLTPGDSVEEGCTKINDALDYDAEKPLDFFNKPKLYVAESCVNTIYALNNWTGADGQKGACRDPIDLLRYFVLSECRYVAPTTFQGRAWGGY